MARRGLFLLFAALVAAVCLRLGVWQLARLGERRAQNALVASRLSQPPVDVDALPRDTTLVRFRRLTAAGVYDFGRELVYAGRTHQGSPGVNFLTPLQLPGRDTLLLVNRGWVYAPDASTVDRARWREVDTTVVRGYAEPLRSTPGQREGADPRILFRLDRAEVERRLGRPVYPFYVVLTDPSAGRGADAIARVEPPPLDEGPHMSYAFQWFAFATIAMAGAVVVARKGRARRAPGDGGGPGGPPRN